MASNFKQVAYRIEPEYYDLLAAILDATRRNGVDEFRLMLDARAQTLGLNPVKPVDPKLSALPLEMSVS